MEDKNLQFPCTKFDYFSLKRSTNNVKKLKGKHAECTGNSLPLNESDPKQSRYTDTAAKLVKKAKLLRSVTSCVASCEKVYLCPDRGIAER